MPSLSSAFKRLNSATFTALLDQFFQSVATFGIMLCLARFGHTELFASYSLAYSVSMLVAGVQRSLVLIPVQMAISVERSEVPNNEWSTVGLLFAIGAFVVSLAAAAICTMAGVTHWVTTSLWLTTIIAPAMCVYEMTRRLLYINRSFHIARRLPITLCVTSVIGVVVLFLPALPQFLTGASLGIGYLVGSAWGIAHLGLARLGALTEARAALWSRRRDALWHLAAFGAHSIYNNGQTALVASVGGVITTAEFSRSRTLVTPPLAVVTAIDSIDKPAAGRAYGTGGFAALRRASRRTQTRMLLITAPYLLLLLLEGAPILAFLSHKHVADGYLIVILWVCFSLLTVLNQPLETQLTVRRRSRRVFTSKVGAGITSLVTLFTLTPLLGVLGAVLSGVIGVAVNLVGNYRAYFEAVREEQPVVDEIVQR